MTVAQDVAPDVRPVVCVLDDDPSVTRALGRLLRTAGFRVVTFISPAEFLASPATQAARCLVLDVRLGERSGFALYEDLASSGRSIPVIFMTAHDDAPSRARAARVGAVAYLRKPFAERLLLEAIGRALSRPPRT
jgi:FixJ family two-component response regulator